MGKINSLMMMGLELLKTKMEILNCMMNMVI